MVGPPGKMREPFRKIARAPSFVNRAGVSGGVPIFLFFREVIMRILISNDDGIHAPGLRALYSALRAAGHEVRAVAPSAERSGASSCITAHRPLFALPVRENDFEGWAVDGTPADCVMLGLNGLYPAGEQPDLVISGINRGPNAGMDVLLSGTVGAAAQGALAGLPALALSNADIHSDSREQAAYAAGFVGRLNGNDLPRGLVWNLNFPACPMSEVRGLKACGHSLAWPETGRFERRTDPYGRPYWWMGNVFTHFQEDDPGTDKGWLHQGFITLTPLRFDLTDRDALKLAERLEERA